MSWFSDYLIQREVWSKRTNYLKLKVNNIVEITDYDVCDIPNCNVDLATMYENYLGID